MICGKAGSSGDSRLGCGSVRGRSAASVSGGGADESAASTSLRGSPIRPGRQKAGPGEGTGLARYLFAALLAGARFTAFLAGARLAGALRAVALRAGAFLAAARAGAFLAAAGAADLPAAATAASLVGYAPLTSFGAVAGARTASLNALTGVMRAFLEALIRMASPVAGLRPMRAARFTLTNLANPGIDTGSPFDTTAVTTSVKPSRTAVTVFSSTSACTATAFASSLLFMGDIVAEPRGTLHIDG